MRPACPLTIPILGIAVLAACANHSAQTGSIHGLVVAAFLAHPDVRIHESHDCLRAYVDASGDSALRQSFAESEESYRSLVAAIDGAPHAAASREELLRLAEQNESRQLDLADKLGTAFRSVEQVMCAIELKVISGSLVRLLKGELVYRPEAADCEYFLCAADLVTD